MKKDNTPLLSYVLSLIFDKFVKIKRNRVVFTSFNGHFSDSPRQISDALHRLSEETEIVWLVDKRFLPLVPDYAKGVDIKSKQTRKYTKNARAFVDNVYWLECYTRTSDAFGARLTAKVFKALAKHKKQYFFTTWHGTPLKRMGRDQIGNTVYDFVCPKNSYMLLGNQFTLDIMKHLTFDKMNMELIGCPRNDLLFCDDAKKAELKTRLGLPADKKIILYAPTFRSDGKDTEGKNVERSGLNQLNSIDFDKLFSTLGEKFGGDFAFVGRFHYHVESMVDFSALDEKYPGKIINGNLHDDMADYLAVTDVLLTDASSCMFDFALTKRPCFLLFPDLEHYGSSERGFYMNIADLPFPCSIDTEGLISDISGFEQEKYENKIDNMLTSLGFVDDKDSSERVAKYILEKISKGSKK